jgi:flagellar hook-length control protein FliK
MTFAMITNPATSTTSTASDGSAGQASLVPVTAAPMAVPATGDLAASMSRGATAVGPYAMADLSAVAGTLSGRLRGGDGAHTLVVHLSPEALGPVVVNATLRDGSLEIRLAGGVEAARGALRDALGDLTATLAASGTDVTVTVDDLLALQPPSASNSPSPDPDQRPAAWTGQAAGGDGGGRPGPGGGGAGGEAPTGRGTPGGAPGQAGGVPGPAGGHRQSSRDHGRIDVRI